MTSTKVNGDDHKIKIVTPAGEAKWASLKSPKSWNGDDGKYQISVVLTEEDAQPLIDQCNGMIEKMVDLMGKRPKISQYDPYKKLDDGRYEFRFKRKFFKANDKYPATAPISTLMPDGSKVDWDKTDWSVGNGSIVQVGAYMLPYYTGMLGLGISLRLMAVNIVKLEKYEGGKSDDFDFVSTNVGTEEVNSESMDF